MQKESCYISQRPQTELRFENSHPRTKEIYIHESVPLILKYHMSETFSQAVVEEIQIKSADLGEIQKLGHDLMGALSGNAHSIS